MRIAICDDCLEDIEKLKKMILENEACPDNVEFYEYSSGDELLSDYQEFDGIFLDMQMEGMDGNMTAHKIRQCDSRVLLSFYSGFETPANLILKSHPYSYILKNSNDKEFSLELTMFLEELSRRKVSTRIFIRDDGRIYILETTDILYISIYNKGSKIWITDQRAEELWGKDKTLKERSIRSADRLANYYERLKDSGFFYGSKSYIINAEKVIARLKDSVKLVNGCELSISRSRKNSFDEEFCKYWGTKHNRKRMAKE